MESSFTESPSYTPAALLEERTRLQKELKKKPLVFAILAGVGFLLAVSFLRISLETYASPGDEELVARIGTVLLVTAVLFLVASGAFLLIFILKLTARKRKNRRLQEIERMLRMSGYGIIQ